MTWYRSFQRWRVAWIAGLFLVLEGLYYLSGPPRERSLAVFVLAPLVVGAFGVWRTAAWTAGAALVVTYVTWLAVSPISTEAMAGRLVVVALGGATAVIAARARDQRQAEALDLQVRMQVAGAFGDQLVPEPVALEHFDMFLHYEPGEAGLQVGGDFMDVLQLTDGSVAFIVGDVCGHGPRAAALGVAMRTAWRTAVRLLPPDPARWLEELEDGFADEVAERFVTAATGTIAADGRRCTISSAGHPHPVVVRDRALLCSMANDPPLGVAVPGEARTSHDVELGGGALVLFTDGLWESTRIAPDGTRLPIDAVVDAVTAVGQLEGPADLERLVSGFRPSDGDFDDDVAVLVLRPAGHRGRHHEP